MTQEADFVTYAYTTFLGRNPEAQGLDWWTGQLTSGAITSNELVAMMVESTEFTSDGLPICALYYTLFGRSPDLPGLNYWRDAAFQGSTLASIAEKLMASDEYTTASAGKTTGEMLTQFYQLGLGRDPDDAGYEYWFSEVENGMSLTEVVTRFAESPEAAEYLEKKLPISAVYYGLTGNLVTDDQMTAGLAVQIEDLALTIMLTDSYTGPTVSDLDPQGLIAYISAEDTSALILTGNPVGNVVLDLSQTQVELTDNGQAVSITGLENIVNVNAGALSTSVTLTASASDVVFSGGNAADTLTGGSGNDQLTGNNGTDSLAGADGDDLLDGGGGDDTLAGGDGNDQLTGGGGSDILMGNAGEDILDGGLEADSFTGGGGNDIFVISNASHSSGLAETFDGGEGTDTIRLDFSGTLDLSYATITDVESITFNSDGNTLTLTADQLAALTSITGSAGAEDTVIVTTPGLLRITDTLFTDIDTFQGGDDGSNDIIDDTALGLTLIGGNNADYIEGGTGADTLQGNAGGDVYAYLQGEDSRYAGETAFNADTIVGFDFGSDKIRLANAFTGTTTALTVDSAWLSTWNTLDTNTELQTAFADSDIDAVLLTVTTGSAAGQYLLIEDGTTDTGFQSAEDITIKLSGAVNIYLFDTTDFII
ncbi:DUF4214 domain-containing protein [Desulfobacter curvatus]|uniref:DUF4214 domain-containing protein n=1 Tax=Desulfobacter curvatus TaxID=2290 RepID=UPI0003706AFF|nr:DUF4214 domain-containing protein [Desulfobacter curvatus]